MASIFISHSSKDDALASDLEKWLRGNGFTDLFIDHSAIRAGERWADALRANAGTCRVVACLVTERWLASTECPNEFRAAWYMGKRIVPLFLLADEAALSEDAAAMLARVRAESQGLDLKAFLNDERRLDFARDEARADLLRRGLRAAGALSAVGLDPEAFEIDRALRPAPFPGLASFADDDADAALFFGRSREIAETLEELRAMRAASDRRVLMILGASGAGKSSLLKAGIIPRLRREAPAWIPLRAFRPGADPLLNFAEAIGRTLMDFEVREPDWIAKGTLRRTLFEAWQAGKAAETLGAAAERLRAAANRPGATILIGVDQAEELARAEGESGEALSAYLRAAMDAGAAWRLAFTIRTDSFPELQAHPRFQGLEARGYDLRALPTFKFDDVVSQPAKRYGVEIDHGLVDQLMEDAPGRDALPLLAFAMQRLWEQFAAQGRIGLADYRSMGGLSGLIEDAAERALAGQAPEQANASRPTVRKAQDELGARSFVPPLADVNDEGAAIRRVAAWSEFDEESRALLDRFADWRLVVKKSDTGTVEVAHEALFREWPRLAGWLEPERARLEALRGLMVAAVAWRRSGDAAAQLTHFGERLKAANALEKNARFAPQLDETARAYLAACRKAERREQGRRRMLQAGLATAVVALFAAGAAYTFREPLTDFVTIHTRYRPHVQDAAALAALPDLAAFQDCAAGSADCPEMVLIPAGDFLMGERPEQIGVDDEGRPQFAQDERQRIAVPRFAVSRTEITFDHWAACAAAGGCRSQPSPGDATWGRDDRPVINVSWEDAQEYAAWLSRMTGQDYRLLSEAEWEYAAHGVTSADDARNGESWSFGDDESLLERYAWFQNNSDRRTQPVGTKDPNPFGLRDMHGNVWEWVQDCYAESPQRTDATPVETEESSSERSEGEITDCSSRVLRGGSWLGYPRDLRSAYRNWINPADRVNYIGFRLARTVLPPES